MFVHSVYFWLKNSLSDEEVRTFREGLHSLEGIEVSRATYVGVPANTDRPVIDRSYSFALTVLFDDLAGHDAYQVHPVHKAFVQTYAGYWDRVVIYDAE
ncbi:MAG: Dabb family protein [Candidatus Hydrogenedentes bacterium]|nr:Dabb family protein [Candidatus Hydrogenedentota bacterium]